MSQEPKLTNPSQVQQDSVSTQLPVQALIAEDVQMTERPLPRTVAVVTGASRGLGLAFAHELAAQCSHIITLARQTEADAQTMQIANAHDCVLQHISADLSDPNQWPEISKALQNWMAGLASLPAHQQPERYLLINNAGSLGPMAQFDGLANLEAEQVHEIAQTMNLNISAVIYLSSVFVQAAHQQSQAYFESSSAQEHSSAHEHSSVEDSEDNQRALIQVINISSGAGRKPYPGWGIYCASKAALDRYSEVLQVEAPFAQVVSMAPGVLDTAMQVDIRQSSAKDFPNVQRFIDLHAEQELSPPREVAQEILAYSLNPDFGQQTLQDIRLIKP